MIPTYYVKGNTLCFFFGQISQPSNKKKWLMNPTKGFLGFKKTIILTKKFKSYQI
jgi:hypothetical protein